MSDDMPNVWPLIPEENREALMSALVLTMRESSNDATRGVAETLSILTGRVLTWVNISDICERAMQRAAELRMPAETQMLRMFDYNFVAKQAQ